MTPILRLSISSGLSISDDTTTDLDGFYEEFVYIIDCLYQLSVMVRRPARHDILTDNAMVSVAHFEYHDRKHVREKFQKADPKIIGQLGTSITRVRKHLRYRERHHAKLAGVEIPVTTLTGDTSSHLSGTIASEFQSQYTDDGELFSNAGILDTSYATSLMTGEGLTIPEPPPGSSGGQISECPYCFYLVSINGLHAWQKHVPEDLQPYACISPDCPIRNTSFGSRHEWSQHLRYFHKLSDFANKGSKDKTLSVDLDESSPLTPRECPLCQETLSTLQKFERHVARHPQELALFALPRRDNDEESNEIIESSSDEESEEIRNTGKELHENETNDDNWEEDEKIEAIQHSEEKLDENKPNNDNRKDVELRSTFEMVIHLPNDETKTRIGNWILDSALTFLVKMSQLPLTQKRSSRKVQMLLIQQRSPFCQKIVRQILMLF